jgi:hypothetical protein
MLIQLYKHFMQLVLKKQMLIHNVLKIKILQIFSTNNIKNSKNLNILY